MLSMVQILEGVILGEYPPSGSSQSCLELRINVWNKNKSCQIQPITETQPNTLYYY